MGINNKSEYDKFYRDKSRQILFSLIEKCIKTSMVAAISKVEDEFGNMWGADGSEVTTEMLENKVKFDSIRKHIFDTGHRQIDKAKEELENYDICWNRYQLQMQFKPKENK